MKTDKTISRQIFSVDEDIDQTTNACNDISQGKHEDAIQNDPNIEIPDVFSQSCEDVGDSMKPLSLSNLKELLVNVSTNYSKCTEETQFIIGAIAVNLSKLSINEGNGTCEYDEITNIENVSTDTVMNVHKKCIRQYKSAFTSKHGAFVTNNKLPGKIMQPSDGNVKNQSKQRLKRLREQVIRSTKNKTIYKQSVVVSSNKVSRVRMNQIIGGSCGFCGERDSHSKITSCPMKKKYKTLGREYEISSKDNVSDIKRRIENFMPLAIGKSAGSVMKDLSQEQLRCHFIIHEAFPNYNNRQKVM